MGTLYFNKHRPSHEKLNQGPDSIAFLTKSRCNPGVSIMASYNPSLELAVLLSGVW